MKNESCNFVLTPSRSDVVVQSCFFFAGILIARSTIWAWFQCLFVLLQIRGKKGFSYFGGHTTKNRTNCFDEIGQTLGPGALSDTKKIRKAGADMFANSRLEKPGENLKTDGSAERSGWVSLGRVRRVSLQIGGSQRGGGRRGSRKGRFF